MTTQLIINEKFTSIKEAQAGLTQLLSKAGKRGIFYRVMRNNEPVGVLIPNEVWEGLVEDLEALSSPSYLKHIEAARKSKKRYSSKDVKRILNL